MKSKPNKQKSAVTSKAGRPSKFTPEMARQALFLATKGCTDADLSEFFEVSERTLNTWKKTHPEFLQSLKEGKAIADSAVMRALFGRAIGYSHPDSHVSNFQGKVTVTPIVKRYPPETVACIFWLKNRDPQNWKDKHTVDVKGYALDTFFASLATKTGLQNDISGA